MSKITYVIGDALKPIINDGRRFIVHIVNDIKLWGSGFVLAINNVSPKPREAYLSWENARLGDIQIVDIGNDVYIVNMMAQKNTWPIYGMPPIRYEALRECFLRLKEVLTETDTIHGPRLGSTRSGGSWKIIEKIIESSLSTVDNPVFIYDLPGNKEGFNP